MTYLAPSAAGQRARAPVSDFGLYAKSLRKALSRGFRRFARALYVARSRQALREVARFQAGIGMPMTDEMEREIAGRFERDGWFR